MKSLTEQKAQSLGDDDRTTLLLTSQKIFDDAERHCDQPGYGVPDSAHAKKIRANLCKSLKLSFVGYYFERGRNLLE
ncbi:MAG: hypothetical protein AAGC81_16275 [Pseudomonadota bacterium]